ncbi:MAG: FAD-dependent oxidoreductase [Candidatus Dependentiae bacterium]
MKQLVCFLLSCFFCLNFNFVFSQNEPEIQDWFVVGGGPAGIIMVSLLRDLGIPDNEIHWADANNFTVGRLSSYPTVPGNVKTGVLIKFFKSLKTFQEVKSPALEKLLYNCELDPNYECFLKVIIDPLQEITQYLLTKVDGVQGKVISLDFIDDVWHIQTENNKTIKARYVVLATGSHPKKLNYGLKEIPFDVALDKTALTQAIMPSDVVGVVGSAHSAILILKFLSELRVGRIINFYTEPIKYAVDMGSWILHQEEGLKGITARWAKEVLEKKLPSNLIRIINTPEARKKWLVNCTKIIYACGFERNNIPLINGDNSNVVYNESTGTIGPRLFGFGIAFPEKVTDQAGNTEHRVGLLSFLSYAQRVVPQWITTKDFMESCESYDSLFTIDLL